MRFDKLTVKLMIINWIPNQPLQIIHNTMLQVSLTDEFLPELIGLAWDYPLNQVPNIRHEIQARLIFGFEYFFKVDSLLLELSWDTFSDFQVGRDLLEHGPLSLNQRFLGLGWCFGDERQQYFDFFGEYLSEREDLWVGGVLFLWDYFFLFLYFCQFFNL